jgi:hypothetical protein
MELSDSSETGTWEITQVKKILHKYYDSNLVIVNNSPKAANKSYQSLFCS